jgi:hypothetical protein
MRYSLSYSFMKIQQTLAALFLWVISLSALELGAPFADHVALQRKLPVSIWGWSKPSSAENGKWMISSAWL